MSKIHAITMHKLVGNTASYNTVGGLPNVSSMRWWHVGAPPTPHWLFTGGQHSFMALFRNHILLQKICKNMQRKVFHLIFLSIYSSLPGKIKKRLQIVILQKLCNSVRVAPSTNFEITFWLIYHPEKSERIHKLSTIF